MLRGKKIILGITGSIAAYKAATLVRMLAKQGAEVQVVMTKSATDFITPLTLSTLSGRPVLSEPFQPGTGQWYSHVDWACWADFVLLAPLTANTMSKMAQGQADNLLLAIYLAARCPVFFAPAMDVDMYEHPATQKNIKTLVSYGNILIPPDEGELASGLKGKGRLKEPEAIVNQLLDFLKKKSPLQGIKVLVSAGPTFEKIDPVRFIGNFSSGKMGFALAEAFASLGADVTLVAGPNALTLNNPGIKKIDVQSASEMYETCMKQFPSSIITVMAAAVADYTPENYIPEKIKKKSPYFDLRLVHTRDILAEMGKKKKKNQVLVGFALETSNEAANARQKLENKNLDCIVLNSLRDKGAGFGTDTNKVSITTSDFQTKSLPLLGKNEVAAHIARVTAELLLSKKQRKI